MFSTIFIIIAGTVITIAGITAYNKIKGLILRKPKGFHLNLVEFFLVPVVALLIVFEIWSRIVGTQEVHALEMSGNTLWALEHVSRGTGNWGERFSLRNVFGIRVNDGTYLYKKSMEGNFQRIAQKENIAWCWDDETIVGVESSTGDVKYTIDPDRFESLPAFREGVAGFDMKADGIIRATNKSGQTISIDPLHFTEIAAPPDTIASEPITASSDSFKFAMSDTTNAQLVNAAGQIISKDILTHGRILQVDPVQKIIITRHYENNDPQDFIISAYLFNGTLRWQVRYDQLGVRRFFLKKSLLAHSLIADERFIFSAGNFVVALDIATGRLLWKTAL